MSGTYQGGYHGSGDFGYGGGTAAENAAVHENLKQNAILNGSSLAFVRAGWEPAGFSLSVGGGPGSGSAAVGAGPTVTGGPAAGSVGRPAPTTGPGKRVVASGGAKVGGGGFAAAGWFDGPAVEPGVADGEETLTAYKQFGVWIQPSPWFTDAQYYENRVGDDGPMVWVNQTVTSIADYGHTVFKAGYATGWNIAEAVRKLQTNGIKFNDAPPPNIVTFDPMRQGAH